MEKKRKTTIVQKIVNRISTLKPGEYINRAEWTAEIYGETDYFIQRSFDVSLAKAKKELPDMSFSSIKGNITRIS